MTGETPAAPGTRPTRPKRRSRRLAALAAAGVVVALVAGGAGILVATFDPDAIKPRIVEAVRQATGRDIALNGPIGIKLSLLPTIQVHNLAFANPLGFSRPAMATLDQAELRLDLLALLTGRIDIAQVTLIRPDILLEVNAKGQPNWVFERPAPPPAQPAAEPAAERAGESARARRAVHVASVRIRDGQVAFRDSDPGHRIDVRLADLSLAASGPDAPIHAAAEATINGLALTLKGETGPLARLLDETARTAWPVSMTIASGGATARVEGTLTRPLQHQGYELSVAASVPDLAALAPVLPGIALPPARGLAISARLTAPDDAAPAVSDLKLQLAGADLTRWAAGLQLEKVEIAAPDPHSPVTISLAGRLQGLPFAVGGSVGHPVATIARGQPWPIDLRFSADRAAATAKGSLGNPLALAGIALDVTAQVPDLAVFSPLAARPLPAFRTIALQGRLTDGKGGLRQAATLSDLRLTLPEGDIAGSASLAFGLPPALTATLVSARIDLDAILAIAGGTPPAAPASAAPSPAAPPPAAAPAPPPAGRTGRVFPDTPLPYGLLQRADADVSLKIGVLRAYGTDARSVVSHVVLRDGHLRVDPLTADTPEGALSVTLSVDATAPQPPVALAVRAPGLALRSLLTAFGAQPFASGQLEVDANLHGAGESLRALAAGLNGHVGLAMAGGSLDTRLIGGALGRVSPDLQILDLMGRGGASSAVQCLAIRFDAANGIAKARTMVLGSGLMTADGGGTVDLRTETMNLLLRPQGRVGGTGFRVPLRVTGPLRSPRVDVDATAAAEANAGRLAGIIIGNTTPLGIFGGLLGSDALPADGGSPCPAALIVARGGTVPVEAAQAPDRPAAAPPRGTSLPNAGAILRQFLR